MSASKVYFTDMRCPVGTGLLDKLKKLIEKAGIDSIDMDSKFVAIKIHFGEPGNLSFLRPNFAKMVADKVTSLGGRPFLTDCNTLYVGRRKHALEHLAAAQENGFSPLSTGCQMIIADGLKGTDEMEVPLEGCDHFQSAFIGRAIMDADIFISLTHFKGHELTGFGGAIKNIGMGCGSRAGKMAMHSIGKPGIDAEKCRGCHQHQRAGPVRPRAPRPLHRYPSQDQLAQPDRACPEDRHRQRGLRAGDREVRTAPCPRSPGTAHAQQKTASFDAVFFMAFRPAAVRPRKGRLSGRAVFSRRI